MSDAEEPAGGPTGVDVDVEIDDDRTLVTVTGEREAAVIVESESGERVYLPPEDFREGTGETDQTPYDSPYEGAVHDDSPYESAHGDESPYQRAGEGPYGSGAPSEQPIGVQSTPDGFRVLHPEPVTDVRLLRQRT